MVKRRRGCMKEKKGERSEKRVWEVEEGREK